MARCGYLLLFALPVWADTVPYQPAKNADEAIQRIEALGGTVRTVSVGDEALDVDWQGCVGVTDAHLQYLAKLKNVRVVRLRGTAISDTGLTHLATITTLTRLHLDRTAISDAGLKHLVTLRELEVLNLYGTKITDAGLGTIKELPKLRSLFLAETNVTATGIQSFQQALPKVQITPDLAKEREQAQAAWAVAKTALVNAEANLARTKKDAEELAPKAAQLKKDADEATKQANEVKKQADEAKKKLDDADKAAKEARNQLENAQRAAKSKPDDPKLQQTADAKKVLADAAQKLFAERKAMFDEIDKRRQTIQTNAEQLRQSSNLANNAKNRYADAQLALEAAKQLESNTRQRAEERK